MLYNYFIFIFAIVMIIGFTYKMKKLTGFRLLGIVAGLAVLLIAIEKIFLPTNRFMQYPIYILFAIVYILASNELWKIRKLPGVKKAIILWFVVLPAIVFVLAIFLILVDKGILFGNQ